MPWFKFKSHLGELQSAQVRARLELGSNKSCTIDFLVDSGASRSLVPATYVQSLMPKDPPGHEVSLGMQDANGGWIQGRLIQFRVQLLDAPSLPITEESFGVSTGVRWPILGLTWFKKVGVHFRNFGSHWRGPGFAVYVDRGRTEFHS